MTQEYKSSNAGPAEAALQADCCDLGELLQPRLFRALADSNRIALLARLASSPEPQTVGELNGCCSIDLSVVSRHLAVLRDAGVVRAEKRGRKVYYNVCCEALASVLRGLAAALEGCAANRSSHGGAQVTTEGATA